MYFAMALCAWRDDWPPDSDAVRLGIFQAYNEIVDFTKPFVCSHPLVGPEELRCYTSANITHTECRHYKSELGDIMQGTVKITSTDDSREAFSLCRLDLYCDAHTRRDHIVSSED